MLRSTQRFVCSVHNDKKVVGVFVHFHSLQPLPTITETTLSANILRNDRMKENMVERTDEKLFKTRRSSRNGNFHYFRKGAKSMRSSFEMDYGHKLNL
jgi:hypothetical protein